jgi:hypothetical protein
LVVLVTTTNNVSDSTKRSTVVQARAASPSIWGAFTLFMNGDNRGEALCSVTCWERYHQDNHNSPEQRPQLTWKIRHKINYCTAGIRNCAARRDHGRTAAVFGEAKLAYERKVECLQKRQQVAGSRGPCISRLAKASAWLEKRRASSPIRNLLVRIAPFSEATGAYLRAKETTFQTTSQRLDI